MKEHVLRFIGAVFLTILALLGIGAVLHILLTLPWEGKGPEWVGAIGTVATLIGTIILARQETRRRRRQEHDAAVVAAAFMDLPLIGYRQILGQVLAQLRKPVEDDFENPWRDMAEELGKCPAWTQEQLQPLLYLGNHVAADLAIAQDYVRDCRDRLATTAIQKNVEALELFELADINAEIADVIEEAYRRVDRAFGSCSDLLDNAKVI